MACRASCPVRRLARHCYLHRRGVTGEHTRGDGQHRRFDQPRHTCPRRTMPNIYYCNGLADNDLGTLRVVLSWEECRKLLRLYSVQYTGLQFPTIAEGRASDSAVLRILDEERDDKWQAGFYSFDGDLLHIEEWVQTCIRSRIPPPAQKLAD